MEIPMKRTAVRQETDTATTAEERLERPRLSTSAARRMRRKRAAERAAQAALEHRGEKVAPLSAGRAAGITGMFLDVSEWWLSGRFFDLSTMNRGLNMFEPRKRREES